MTYDEYMKSPAWHAFRLLVLARDEGRCVLCDSDDRVQVHHRRYTHFTKELLSDCYALCTPHHDMITDDQRRERYLGKVLPPLSNIVATTPSSASYQWKQRTKDTPDVTNCQVSAFWGSRSPSAQWAIGRPPFPVVPRAEED